MAKHDDIRDEALRKRLAEAHELLRSNHPTEAVRVIADAFVEMVTTHPELKARKVGVRGREIPILARWPALGANLDLASLSSDAPSIEFVRERFAMSEALTYYEFTVDTARGEGL